MRSKLFVPGSRPELFTKALSGAADALSFDLEDSVVADRKAHARQALQALIDTPALVGSDKTIIVRVNPLDSRWFEEDVAALARPGVDLINLPKPESVDDVLTAVHAVETAERRHGVVQPIGLLLNIETPRAMRRVHELASAHPRVAGLQLGLGDLFEPLQIARRDTTAVHQMMLRLRLAAGEAGIFAYDGAFADVRDSAGFCAEAEMSRRLGFLGKSCIHPSQVPLANQVYRPGDDEIAHSRKVVAAAAEAEARGVGACMVDGQMIDAPFVMRARGVLEIARRLGLDPSHPLSAPR